MTEQDYFNQGLQQAAKNYPVLEELDAINRRGQMAKASRVDVVRYEVQEQPAPYKNTAEAVTDLAIALAKPAIVLTALAAGVGTIISVSVMAIGAAATFVAQNAVFIGGGVVLLSALVVGVFGAGSSSRADSGSGGSAGSGQNINVTVNVTGGSVNSNLK